MKRKILWFVLVGVLGGAGVLLYAEPAIIAIACPSCMGFDHMGKAVYVERAMPIAQRDAVAVHIRKSSAAVEAFFGGLTTHPMVFACATERCYRSLGGKGARGAAFGAAAIRLSPRGLNDAIATHELAHIEFHFRLGMWATICCLATWFDEGLAVLVSQDERYVGPPTPEDMTGAEVRKLLSLGEWTAASQVHGPRTYPAAYREVKEWYDKAGHAGLMDFINRLRQGTSFADAMASVVEGSQKPNEDRGA